MLTITVPIINLKEGSQVFLKDLHIQTTKALKYVHSQKVKKKIRMIYSSIFLSFVHYYQITAQADAKFIFNEKSGLKLFLFSGK